MNPSSQAHQGGHKPKLLDQVRYAIRTKHDSLRTEEAYVQWSKRFILFPNTRHPRDMGTSEINQFVSHLAVKQHVAASTQNQALSAILFLYKEVLTQEIASLGEVVWAKKPKRLPVVFTREEVKAVLSHLSGTQWIMASLLYGSGLRLMECMRLRVKDIDFSSHQSVVREAKGDEDRVTRLPLNVKPPLQHHMEHVKRLHAADRNQGCGTVYVPYALERTYPNAQREWGWP